MSLFKLIVDNVGNLIKYQGENKYTKTIRLLNRIRLKFNAVVEASNNLYSGMGSIDVPSRKSIRKSTRRTSKT